VQRLINQDRNSFAASMVALGDADGMVTGVTRTFDQALEEVLRVIDPAPGGRVMGMSIVLAKGRTLFIADTSSPNCRRPPSWPRSPSRPPAPSAGWASPRAWPS
jgi:phosphotransacetylase